MNNNGLRNYIGSVENGQEVKLRGVSAQWQKVNRLKAGTKIAVVEDSFDNVFFDEIVSIKKVGREQVYDIEVEGTHNFVGNAVLAHNTYISGNLGVGSSSPVNNFEVLGKAVIGSSYAQVAAAPTDGLLVQGNVGIGTTVPAYALDVKASGTGIIARFNSDNATGCTLADGGTISCSSDVNLKKNISDLGNLGGLSDLMKLRPVAYNWKTEVDGAPRSLGFIAQEVEGVLPKLVTTDASGLKQLNTIGLVPVLTRAVQELDLKLGLLNVRVADPGGLIGFTPSTSSGDKPFDDRLAELTARVTGLEASASAGLIGLDPKGSNPLEPLHGFGPEATGSAEPNSQLSILNSQFVSLDEVKGEIGIDRNLVVYKNLNVLGRTTVNDLYATGKVVVGFLTIEGISPCEGLIGLDPLRGSNPLEDCASASISTMGADLKLQNHPLAGRLDIFNGQVVIEKDGSATFEEVRSKRVRSKLVETDELMVGKVRVATDSAELIGLDPKGSNPLEASASATPKADATIGDAAIPAGQTTIFVANNQITAQSKVFITTTTPLSQTLAVTQKTPFDAALGVTGGFTVELKTPEAVEVKFDYWIIN